jgi:hypothetical protein
MNYLVVSAIFWLRTDYRCVCLFCLFGGGREGGKWSPFIWHYVLEVCPTGLHPTSENCFLFGSQNVTNSPIWLHIASSGQAAKRISTNNFPPKAGNCPHFMQPASSLPCSQQPAALPYPDPDQFRPRPLVFFIHKPLQYYSFVYT